jgi:hypothetical protein
MKVETGMTVRGKEGEGIITKIITKSTGYVEVTYTNGKIKKEMAFNLKVNGELLKSKPVHNPLTEEQQAKLDAHHAAFVKNLNLAKLEESYLQCQIDTFRRNGMLNNDNSFKS